MTEPVVARRRATRIADSIVIVGAGQAGAQAAFTLRENGYAGAIVLLGDEPQPPYQRPPLSKKFLANSLSVERLLLRPHEYYAEHAIDLRLHVHVEGIDSRRQRVLLHGGHSLPYDTLLLATGSRPMRLDVAGARSADVHYLRNLQDALGLRRKLCAGTRLAVVGGGYIGLEVAATARAAGARVSVFERDDRLMKRVTTPPIADFLERVHRRNEVEISCSTQVVGFDVGERLEAVILDGERRPADVAVVGIGAAPNVELAQAAGLACANGIVVDEYCRTSDPAIYAAGDCTNHFNALMDSRLRLESVQNAVDQATHAALNMIGIAKPYREIPWFWSQQYEYKLQSAGSCSPCDEVEIRGDPESGRFALLYRDGGTLCGIDAINMPRDYMEVRKKLDDERRESMPGAGATPIRIGRPIAEPASSCPP